MILMRLAAIVLFTVLLPLLAHAASPVALSETENTYTLDNGILAVQVSKSSGNLTSLKYHGLEMLDAAAHQAGYWEHDASRGRQVDRITIDPHTNGGQRAEVSVQGISSGTPMGGGPGGTVVADVEIRYALARGDSAVYTYEQFSHPTNYPATSVGESRFCVKLNDNVFDWMTVDANRNMKMITAYDWNHGTQMNMKEARRMNSGVYQGQVEHKYDYSANQFDVRAWGWSSTEKHAGLWFVNPSVEYLSGGPTKVELSAHRDATFNTNNLTAPAPPTLLNYWRGSHYGGSICNIAATDAWTKVVGPFLIYCNSGGDHNHLWHDAQAKAVSESRRWPYDWVQGVDYPHKGERGTVTGKIVLNDPQAPGLVISNLLVGLTAPDYAPAIIPRTGRPGGRFGGGNGFGGGGGFGLAGGGDDEIPLTNQDTFGTNSFSSFRTNRFGRLGTNGFARYGTNGFGRYGISGGGRYETNGFARFGTNGFRGRFGRFGGGAFALPKVVDWQIDAKNYEFWVRADAKGNYTIPNVRPGTYTLHAFADGVLGELAVSNVQVTAGGKMDLGSVNWQPVRYGKQLWEIGLPNRKGSEFFKGDDYFHWGWYLQYPKLFPDDVHYVIGQSDYHKDWFFEQVPHNDDPDNTTGTGRGSATTWTISFNLPEAAHGRATLRLPICGVGTRNLSLTMNGQNIGSITNLIYNAAINRDGITGYWTDHTVSFDASVMTAGTNVLALTIPPGSLANGIIYDYLRLELDENAQAKSP